MKRIFLTLLFLLCCSTVAHAQFDPCSSPGTTKRTFSATITSATTTELVAAVANQNVHLCGLHVETSGTSPTWQLKVGTKVTNPCDTSGATVSPAFGVVGISIMGFGASELLNTGNTGVGTGVASSELCVVSAGTITDIWMYGTFVQSQP